MLHFNFKKLFILVWVFSPYTTIAQQKFITISGRIVDQSQKSVPFANIHLQLHNSGTAANADGEFVFKIPERWAADSLVISSIGFNTIKKPIESIDSIQIISLQPSVIELKEITVTGETALGFVKRAVEKIPQNYDTSSFHMNAFYKENTQFGDFELTNSEVVLDIFKTWKPNTKKIFHDQLRILKGRKKKITLPSDMLYYSLNLSNGARGTLTSDFVKSNREDYNPLSPSNFKYYTYEFGLTIQDGNRLVQLIDVEPKKKSRKGLMKLKLYIDQETMAFERIEAEMTQEGVNFIERSDKGVGYSIMSLYMGYNTNYNSYSADINYKLYQGKWYLNTVNRHFELLVNSRKRKIKDRKWSMDGYMQITDIDTQNKSPITLGNIGNNEASIASIIGDTYDEAFWENFNIVKPIVPDSLKTKFQSPKKEELKSIDPKQGNSSQQNKHHKEFTRADTLRGKLSPLRTCYDVLFYHLDIAVDMNVHSIKGSNLIRFAVKNPFRTMQIDLFANMKIDKIIYHEKPLQFKREFDAVFVEFPQELINEAVTEIRIFYEGVPKTPDWSIPMNGGLLWDKDEQSNPWAQMVCQGSGASLWWPNKDHLLDEPDSMKIWITVPKEYTEVSNGRLIHKTRLPNDHTRYEWSVSYPINNYNVTFNIGKYTHYRDYYVTNDTLMLDYYVMPYNLDRSKLLFSQVKPMLKSFETYFGKYPFSRDGFTLVESLYPMEHQSGVCIGKITDENANEHNPLVWHESAHEWWGNAVSCTDLADMWIHEAFATYAESLVIEDKFGKELGQKFLIDAKSRIVNREPIIGKYNVNDIFYDIEDMYSKGSLVLNTFRNVLNNDLVWFDLLRSIQNHFRYKTISTKDLISFINEKTKTDYTYFFDQYLHHTALPQLEIKLKQEGKNLMLDYRWKCNVPTFKMPIKVTTSPDHFEFIYPETTWKSTTLKNIEASEFEVDEDGSLVTVSDNIN